MITQSIELCHHMWRFVLSTIWRKLHRDIEIDRLPYEEKVKTFSFSGGGKAGLPHEWGGRGNFLWGNSYPSACYALSFFKAYHPVTKLTIPSVSSGGPSMNVFTVVYVSLGVDLNISSVMVSFVLLVEIYTARLVLR